MALINCSIQNNYSESAEQNSGQADISNYELFIVPNEGYVVSASDFLDNTQSSYPQQSDGTDYHDIFESISLSDTDAGEAVNQVKITVNFVIGYSITADTILLIDIDGFAVDARLKTVTLALIEDMSNSLEDGLNTATFEITSVEEGVTASSANPYTANTSAFGFSSAAVDNYNYFTTQVIPGEQKKIATVKCKVTDNLAGSQRYFAQAPHQNTDAGSDGYDKFQFLQLPSNQVNFELWSGQTVTIEKTFDLWFTEPEGVGVSPNLSAGLHDEGYSLNIIARVGTVVNEAPPEEPLYEVPQVGEVWLAANNPYANFDGVVTKRTQEIEGDDSGGVTGFITAMSDMEGDALHSWDDWSDTFSQTSQVEWPNITQLEQIELARTTLEANDGFVDFVNSYWSSSPSPYIPGSALYVFFTNGSTYSLGKSIQLRVRGIKTFSSPAYRGGVVGARHEVTNVRTNLNEFTNNASNIIPSSGITKTNAPRVDIHGVPGSRFSVEFRETAVVESITGRSLGAGGVDYFDGLLPDMPDGIVAIPASGIYSFKFPDVIDWSDSSTVGWKEFEMKIIAASNTAIKSKVVKKGGISTNIGRLGSTVTNKFYQYPNVNIKIQVNKETGSTYDGTNHLGTVASNATHIFLGGEGATKTGKPKESISGSYKYTSDQQMLDFEIIVHKGSLGVFSLNTSSTLDQSSFVATDKENDCVVNFSNLQADIGRGLADGTNSTDYANVSGTIHFKSFGLQDQVFTLDLANLFNNA